MKEPLLIETAINIKRYYKDTNEYYKNKVIEITALIKKLNKLKFDLQVKVKEYANAYKVEFDYDILSHPEYIENKYINGDLSRIAHIMYDCKNSATDTIRFAIITLYKYSNTIVKLNSLAKELKKAEEISSISYKEYIEIVKTYYTEVQRHLILKGEGYYLGKNLGKICINRCIVKRPRPKIDFAASKKNKQKLLNEGVELYDKAKADYYKKFNIPYNGVDWRIYKHSDCVYEFAYFGLNIPNNNEYDFKTISHRDEFCRKYSNKELADMYRNNIDKVFDTNADLATKLYICLDINPNLYVNYIRNDEQKTISDRKVNRKN